MSKERTALANEAIAALTFEHISQVSLNGDMIAEGEAIPLLQRSIANELRRIDSALGPQGSTLLFGIAEGIDQALLALEQIRRLP